MLFRRIIMLPVLVFALIAIFNLILGETLFFFLWSFAALMISFVVFPITTSMNDRTAPVFHIAAGTPLLILVLAAATFYDFRQAGISPVESLLFGLALGFLIIAFMMVIKGK